MPATGQVHVYRRGLDADNLAESFYRGLMRALAAGGNHAEALTAFRRCGELLSIVLGVKPSTAPDRLYREIVEIRIDKRSRGARYRRAALRDGRHS